MIFQIVTQISPFVTVRPIITLFSHTGSDGFLLSSCQVFFVHTLFLRWSFSSSGCWIGSFLFQSLSQDSHCPPYQMGSLCKISTEPSAWNGPHWHGKVLFKTALHYETRLLLIRLKGSDKKGLINSHQEIITQCVKKLEKSEHDFHLWLYILERVCAHEILFLVKSIS